MDAVVLAKRYSYVSVNLGCLLTRWENIFQVCVTSINWINCIDSNEIAFSPFFSNPPSILVVLNYFWKTTEWLRVTCLLLRWIRLIITDRHFFSVKLLLTHCGWCVKLADKKYVCDSFSQVLRRNFESFF